MFLDLKRLFKESVVYGFGHVLNRIGAILLLPLYTQYLTLAEYGTLELFYVTSNILTLFIALGVEHATLRFYFEYDSKKDRNAVISTAAIATFFISLIILVICGVFADKFSIVVFGVDTYRIHFLFLFGMILISVSRGVFFAYIRAIGKPVFYVIMSFSDLLFKIIFNYYFIVSLNLGVLGVLAGNLLGSWIVWMLLAVYCLKKTGLYIHFNKLKEIYLYSYPLVAVGFFGMIINTADRFLIKHFLDLTAVGIYALVFRLGSILRFIYEEPFTKAYGPFRFDVMKKEDAKEIYSRVLTYYILGLSFVYLGISFFTEFIVKIMAKDSYWAALPYLPLIALIVGIRGLYYHFQIGIYIKKNTHVLWKIFLGATVINLALNFLLIPHLEIYGSIIASFSAAIFINILTFYQSQKVYNVKYEWFRIMKIILMVIFLMALSETINLEGIYDFLFKTALLFSYPLFLYIFKFLNSGEIQKLKALKQKVSLNSA
jgi:O-antigen/teichoic acid export membrane protein